jgi:hypothetical protein
MRRTYFALTPCVPLSREAGEGEPQGAPPFTPTPLSHAVGEGLGVRAKSGRALYTANPSDVPLSDLQEGAVVNSVRAIGIIPIAEPEFTKTVVEDPLLEVPPACRGTEWARLARFPSRSGGNLKEGGDS